MTNGVFYHKADSHYDDKPEEHYHFPSIYLGRVEDCVGDRIIYYGPITGKKGRYYTATARVRNVRPDPIKAAHYYADIDPGSYLDFDQPVHYLQNGGYERKLVRDGRINGGQAVNAVRLISPQEFASIAEAGLSSPDDWPDRDASNITTQSISGFDEDSSMPFDRPIIQHLLNRPFREAKFRQHIRRIYDRTCAFTGLRLINGGGRPEVEAAHIRPVEDGGSDSIRNGIALSATMHWMFDRGLLSLSADFSILQSRQLNYDVSHILNKDMKAKVPTETRLQPHPDYLSWHRNHTFKA
jgi:putative restriction endonuclease